MLKYLRPSLATAALSLFAVQLSGYANIPWVLNGPAAIKSTDGIVRLTDQANNRFGSMWNPCQINITQDFDLSFAMNWGVNACGADGIAFNIQSEGTNELGSDPGMHAYDNEGASMSIVFDTYANSTDPYNDPPYDSLNIRTASNTRNAGPASCNGTGVVAGPTGCGRPAISATQFNIKDGLFHTVRIQWSASTYTLTVDVDGMPRATWVLPSGYLSTIFNGATMQYFGFTSATGGFTNFHQVALISGTVNNGVDVTANPCVYTPSPTPVFTSTPFIIPTSTCGTATPMPSFTYSPTPAPPTATFSHSPTPYPPGCGPPSFQEAKVHLNSCLGSTGSFNASYSFTPQPNQLLVLRMNTSSGGGPIGAVTFAGVPMTQWAFSLVGQSDDRKMYTYYLASPPTSGSLVVNFPNANCSWNVVTELYYNVDVSNPVGGSTVKVGGNAGASSPFPFNFNYTTSGPASLISVFLTSDQAAGSPVTQLSPGFNMNLDSVGPVSIDGGGAHGVSGHYWSVGGPGTYTLNFNGTQANRWWDAQPMEIRGATCSLDTPTASPTATPSFSPSAQISPSSTHTSTPSRTASPSPSFSPTQSLVYSATHSPTASPSFTPSTVFSATSSATPSATRTHSASATFTPSRTSSFTPGPPSTSTRTPTPTPSVTETWTPGLPTPTPVDTPVRFKVLSVYPNPVGATGAQIVFALPFAADVTFKLFDLRGELVWTHSAPYPGPGNYQTFWGAVNSSGNPVSYGAYYLKAKAEGTDKREEDQRWLTVIR